MNRPTPRTSQTTPLLAIGVGVAACSFPLTLLIADTPSRGGRPIDAAFGIGLTALGVVVLALLLLGVRRRPVGGRAGAPWIGAAPGLRCAHCGYPARDAPDWACPECGLRADVEPPVPASTRTGSRRLVQAMFLAGACAVIAAVVMIGVLQLLPLRYIDRTSGSIVPGLSVTRLGPVWLNGATLRTAPGDLPVRIELADPDAPDPTPRVLDLRARASGSGANAGEDTPETVRTPDDVERVLLEHAPWMDANRRAYAATQFARSYIDAPVGPVRRGITTWHPTLGAQGTLWGLWLLLVLGAAMLIQRVTARARGASASGVLHPADAPR